MRKGNAVQIRRDHASAPEHLDSRVWEQYGCVVDSVLLNKIPRVKVHYPWQAPGVGLWFDLDAVESVLASMEV